MSSSKPKAGARLCSLASLHKKALKNLLGLGGRGPAQRQQRKPSTNIHSDGTTHETPTKDHHDLESLQKELETLRRRKALLAGEVEELCHGSLLEEEDSVQNTSITVADELEHVRMRASHALPDDGINDASNKSNRKWSNRAYLHKYDDRDGIGLVTKGKIASRKRKRSSQSNRIDGEDIDKAISDAIHSAKQELTARNIAQRMHTLRSQRQILAAHRLAGISVLPFRKDVDAQNILGIRLDCCLSGEFVARYHLFFDMAVLQQESIQNTYSDDDKSDENPRTVFRLAQHTLPSPGVTTKPILERHFGPDCMLPVGEEDSLCNEHVLLQIQRCIGDIYDACHSFEMRREACRYLKSKEDEVATKTLYTNSRSRVLVQNVVYNDGYDRIAFEFSPLKNDNESLRLLVQLCYDNQLVSRPTALRTQIQSQTGQKGTTKGDRETNVETTNDGEDMHSNLANALDELREVFLSHPIPTVLEEHLASIFLK